MLWLLTWAFTSLAVARSHPLDLFRPATVSAERAWSLWGWFWAPDSTVVVIDRENPVTFPSRPALFGAELKQSLLGYVIPLSSFATPCQTASLNDIEEGSPNSAANLGCSKLCPSGSRVPGTGEPWIALVQRGNCSFASKAREAQRWGAKAVVVGGDDPHKTGHPDVLISMIDPGETGDVNITATFIKFVDYTQLNDLINHSDTIHSGLRTVSLLISSDAPAGGWISPAFTFITILLLPSLITFITLLIHRFRMVRAARRERAPEDIVRNLPWRVWTGNGWEKHEGVVPGQAQPVTTPAAAVAPADAEQGILANASTSEPSTRDGLADDEDEPAWAKTQNECAICLSEFAVGDRVRVLPCAHIFHMDEVDGWLINNKKLCPVCKADVTQPPGEAAEHDPEEVSEAAASPASPATEHTPLLPRVASDNISGPR